MRAGTQVLEVVAAVAVGDDRAAVLEVEPHAADAGAVGIAGAARHATGDEAAVPEQVGGDLHAGLGGIGRHAVHARHRAVGRGAGPRAGTDPGDVIERDRAAGRNVTDGERQGLARGVDGRIRQRRAQRALAQVRGPRHVAEPARQPVHDAHRVRGERPRVAHTHDVAECVADRDAWLRGGLGHDERPARRVDRDVDGRRGGEIHVVGLAERAPGERVGTPGQVGERRGIRRRRKDVAGGWFDAQPVAAGVRHHREAVRAGRERVHGAARIGDRRAGDHLARIRRDAVVAVDDRRLAGRGIDQRQVHALDGRTGERIEHEAARIDERGGDRGIGILRVIVARDDARGARHLQHAVAALRGADRSADDAGEDAGVGARLGEHEVLDIAGGLGRDRDDDRVDHGRIEVLVVVRDAHEDRIAVAEHGRVDDAHQRRPGERRQLRRLWRRTAARGGRPAAGRTDQQ